MNLYQTSRLLYEIYKKDKLPNLDYIESLGLLSIKIAQLYAVRIDFLTPEKCQHLAKLYSRAAELPTENAKKIISKNTDEGWLDNFSDFDFKPFAAASVAQVHKAKLSSGQELAIKIVKERTVEDFKKDIKNLEGIFKLIFKIYPPLKRVGNPLSLLKSIENMTLNELNLCNELEGADKLRGIYEKALEKTELPPASFPQCYKDLSSTKILVSDFVDAPTFDQLIEEGKMDYEKLKDLFHIQGYFMFVEGVFHGDIHPGNILLKKDGSIYFLDCGYISTVPESIKKPLYNMMLCIADDQFEEAAMHLHDMSDIKIGDEKMNKFKSEFIELYKDFSGKSVGEISLTKQMMRSIKMGVLYGMQFSESSFDIIKNLMFLDGMVLRTNPDAKLLKDALPLLKKYNNFI